MRKLLLFLVLFSSMFSHSQNAQDLIDNLKKELKNNPDAKKTATIYSDLTWYYANISTDSALVYGKKAIIESTKLKDSVVLAQVYSDLGAVYFRRADYKASKDSYLKGYQIRKIRNDKTGMAKIAANLANIYNKENKKTLALKSYLESVDYFQKTNNLEAAALTNANIGSLFMDLKNYSKSMSYTKKAIEYQEINNLDIGLSTSYLTLGNIYLRFKDTVNALKFYNKSIISSKKSENNVALSSALNNISNIKINQNKNDEATKLINTSSKIIQKLNVNSDESSLPLNLVTKNISDRKFDEAKILLYKLKRQYSKNESFKSELSQTYLYLSQVHAYTNSPDSASYYIDLSKKLQDKIIEETVQRQTNEFEAKYQSTKKEKQLLEKEIEIENSRNKLIAVTSIAFFIGLIGFLIYRQQKLKNKQQEQEYELKTAISQIETQNKLHEQRLSISRDLHDNIGAQLTFVISSIDNLKFGNKITDNKVNSQLTKISDFTKSTIIELRDTIWAMNTNEFTYEDLHSRILNFIEKAKSAKDGITFKFNIDERLKAVKFSSVIGINLYRTIQEAVNNAIKYADCKEISVDVVKENNQIKIEIKDNGEGFDLETIDFGNGLYNMQKRIEEVGGICEIKSEVSKGTTITILLTKKELS
ncbi:sensor histidine kinase [Flavobacterium sp. SUN052]|uniref:tetratricopeptide repeat-containing sensor histidine kinase n=1 Tax=Flavobacterium sp. SUN052 TaxID=3002441 RepID=UPI00237D3EC7|nr:sensor histidine kinase [Flavobacterium sp. SUN052]MEC4004731.1 sensor histidine kinase [Flavobacterium sp. SUN052]